MTFDDLPRLEIGEGYVSISIPGTVSIDGKSPITILRIITLRPADAEKFSEKLLKCVSIAREIGPKEEA